MGFSTSTCLPAAMASRAIRLCSLWGDATYTMSTFGSNANASKEPWTLGMPNRPANALERSWDRPATATAD